MNLPRLDNARLIALDMLAMSEAADARIDDEAAERKAASTQMPVIPATHPAVAAIDAGEVRWDGDSLVPVR